MKHHRANSGRPCAGTVITIKSGPRKGQLQGTLTLADGSRKRVPLFPRGMSDAMARERKALAKARAALEAMSKTYFIGIRDDA